MFLGKGLRSSAVQQLCIDGWQAPTQCTRQLCRRKYRNATTRFDRDL